MIPWFKLEGIPVPGLPGVAIQPFGLLVVTGLLVGIEVTGRRANRLGIKRQVISDFIAHVVIIGFIGSHIFDRIVDNPGLVLREPWDLLMPWRTLNSYGGFLFAVAGAFVWKQRRKLDITIPLDQVAFGMPAAWLFGRTGCFVVHDHPGKLTDFFLAVDNYRYPGLPVGPRHDLGLYELLWSAAVTALFFRLDRRARPHGFYIAVIGLLYAPYRFGLDFLREVVATYWGLTPAQYLCVVTLGLCSWLLYRCYRHPIEVIPERLLQAPTTQAAKLGGAKAAQRP